MDPKYVIRIGTMGYACRGTHPNAVTIYRQQAKWFADYADAVAYAVKCGRNAVVYRAYYGQETEYPAVNPN